MNRNDIHHTLVFSVMALAVWIGAAWSAHASAANLDESVPKKIVVEGHTQALKTCAWI